MQRLVEAGKIRAFGLSNESAWGTSMWMNVAERMGAPRVAAVQNEYSLLCRLFDTDMAELSHNEDVALLAFSPLAAGYLTGKYTGGVVPDGSRKTFNPTMGGRASERVEGVAQIYVDLAKKHGLNPVQMSLAWACQRPFPCMPIIGATTLEQLDLMLQGKDLVLSEEVMAELDVTHKAYPMPY